MDFGAMRAFDHVTIRDDAIVLDKEPAAARKLFATRVERFNRNCRRFDTADEFRKKILRRADSDGEVIKLIRARLISLLLSRTCYGQPLDVRHDVADFNILALFCAAIE